ncbi:MAG TPA: acyl-CoA synthetase [Bacteroidia bacterium]|jgi:malonyl-CoA/methylmalonyl-CoA synthetase|nr:acyl-CoA synthetase [Bacteroidia bacterium]
MAATFPERFSEVVVDHPRKKILSDDHGDYSSEHIFNAASFIATQILPPQKLSGKQIAILVLPGMDYVACMLASWMRGAMAVPLCVDHPTAELEYVLQDSEASFTLCHPSLRSKIPGQKNILAVDLRNFKGEYIPNNWDYPAPDSNALMLYTSGTTGKPKGVVHTHASLLAQIECLIEAWKWTEEDSILHFLPLHHTHGIVNKLLCALYSGARCDMLPKFDAEIAWKRITAKNYSLFMAVPTVYAKLVQHWERSNAEEQKKYSGACAGMRLMVSGSAALQIPLLEKWKMISGHILLERYGMTETGMVLSNPLDGERRPGAVGIPLPGMEVRIVNEGQVQSGEGVEGELEVRGKNLFKEYWKRPDETRKAFTPDGWFRTGDMVTYERGYYSIKGRLSTDIIKSGGYKISALEIENIIASHPAIVECCVIGIPDETWGEKIAAVVKLKDGSELSLEALRAFAENKIAAYKLPSVLKILNELPRNAMGKVVKSEARKLL